MIRPPSHRIDAQPIVIMESDSAWDKSRINAECAALGDDALRHPYMQYHAGLTRYDLGAEITLPDGAVRAVTEYLDLAQAWQFHCRRLDSEERYRLDPMLKANELLAYREAFRLTVLRIEGPGAPELKRDALGCIAKDTMEELFRYNDWMLAEVGQAAIVASRPLGPAEKKP
jgi:hypothetical protein